MDEKIYREYVDILKTELVPAMGCTEPISIAYAAAKARKTLGCIPESVEIIGKHAFYGLNNTTIYCEAEAPQTDWNFHYNSSFRPIFFGCILSDDDDYVRSVEIIEKVTLLNPKAKNGISDPTRDGYTFEGWATEENSTTVAYSSENVFEAADGTILYAVWTQQP